MRYLIFDADYNSTGVRDKFEGSLEQEDLGISDGLWNEIAQWVLDYSVITLMSPNKVVLPSSLGKIDVLDQRGVELVEQLLDELKFDVKIEYYSEGMFCYLGYYKENHSLKGEYKNPYKFHNRLFYRRKGE